MADEKNYLEEREAELLVLDEEIKDLQADAARLDGPARAALERQLAQLRDDRDAAGRALQRLSLAGDGQARHAFEQAWARLRRHLDGVPTPNGGRP